MRRGTAVVMLLALTACRDASPTAPAPVPTSTPSPAPTWAPLPTPTGECGSYLGPSDAIPSGVLPPTTTPSAPVDPALGARALRLGDVPCTREARVEALDPYRAGQFSPCGFPFADTSSAIGHYRIGLEPAIGYVGDRPSVSPIVYVEEVVARFTPSGAERVFVEFRTKVEGCPYGTGTNMRVSPDVPQHLRNGVVQSTGWDLAPVDVPVDVDDVYAVEFFKGDSGRYLLVAMRRGPYVAFVRTYYRQGGQRAATPFLTAAASRLAGG